MIKDLQIKTLSNISYNAIASFMGLLCRFIASVVLSRNLSSEDYGIVGFSFVFIEFLKKFDDFGMNNAIIQKKDLDDSSLYTAFTLKFVIGVFLFFVTIVVAPLSNVLFDNKSVILAIRFLSLNFLLNIISFLPISMLKRSLNYKTISKITIISSILNSFISIILALLGWGYWSIIVANLITSTFITFSYKIVRPIRCFFKFDVLSARGYFKYGWSLFATNILLYILFQFDNFVVGNIKGSEVLGYYFLAFNWGSMISVIMWTVVHDVFIPTYSSIQDNRIEIKNTYLRTLEYISFLSILVNITLFINSKDFLFAVLGRNTPKWLPALGALKIFCVYGVIRSILEPIGSVVLATGKTNVFIKANGVAAIIQIICLYPAVKIYGIEGAAIVVAVAYSSQYFIYYRYIKMEFNITIYEILKSLKYAFVSIIPVILIYYNVYFPNISKSSYMFIVNIIFVSFCYSSIYVLVTRGKVIKEIVEAFKSVKN